MTAEPSRSRRLGDLGASDPSRWSWGRGDLVPHLCVMLYAVPGQLASWQEEIKGQHWANAFQVVVCLSTTDMGIVEPFGFVDGISQPALDWHRTRRASSDSQRSFSNRVALGEFLLGYPNEYGRYTDRPLIDRAREPRAAVLPVAEDTPDRRDLGRNGTYLVFRQLRQDVRGFWQFLDREAQADAAERQRLAAAMVGRTLEGKPLLPLSERSTPGIDAASRRTEENQFTYDADPAGIRCPFGAHIRRANPRNADLPSGTSGFLSRLIRVFGFGRRGIRDDLIAAARFHRILRRGREYGTFLPPDQASAPGAAVECGLHFICLAANISRQFEFVQNAWIMGTKFNGLCDEGDPLLGNRQPLADGRATDGFSIPRQDGPPRRLSGMPQFVTLRGGAYFFLPGLRALRYIAGA